jgi:hypothetical protein
VVGVNGFFVMRGVTVTDNDVSEAAIEADAGGLVLDQSTVDCGSASYGVYQHDASLITDSTVTCSRGTAVYSYHGEVQIRRSRVVGATGLYVEDEADSTDENVRIYNSAVGGSTTGAEIHYEMVEIGNSVFWGSRSALTLSGLNEDTFIYGSAFVGANCGITADSDYDARWNAFWDVNDEGCGLVPEDSVTSDPKFVNYPDDLSLESGSPLIDAGPSSSDWEDLDGSRNDIGMYGGPTAF